MEGPPIGPSSSSCHVVAGRICAWIRSRVELPSSATAAGVAVLGWSKRGGWLISRVGEGEAISRIRSWSIIARSRIEVKSSSRGAGGGGARLVDMLCASFRSDTLSPRRLGWDLSVVSVGDAPLRRGCVVVLGERGATGELAALLQLSETQGA